MSCWYVYILRCADQTLYTGAAKDVGARLAVHNSGVGAKYTRSRLPVELLYRESVTDRGAALQREHAIKKLTAAEKRNLILKAGSTKKQPTEIKNRHPEALAEGEPRRAGRK